MYNKFQLTLKYLQFYFTASGGKGHGIHSPFIFDFITNVLNDIKHYPEYNKVEYLREKLLKDQTILTIKDFGAGSAIDKHKLPAEQTVQRTVASVAGNAAKPKKFGQLLYRIVKYYQPQTIVELGTSLGISTSYMSLAKPDAKLITMEGAGEVANLARQNFKTLKLSDIEIKVGNFDNTLSSILSHLSSVNFAFIDGNHRREPTKRYFQQILSKVDNNSIIIFDDIHWSREMEQAWKTIKSNQQVRCSLDLFFIGVVFFRQEFRGKQHFKIRF